MDIEFFNLFKDLNWAQGDDDQFRVVDTSVTIHVIRRDGSPGQIGVTIGREAFERARNEVVERAREWWPHETVDAALRKVLGSDLTEGYLSAPGSVARLRYEGGVFVASGDAEDDENREGGSDQATSSRQRGIFFLGPEGPEGFRGGGVDSSEARDVDPIAGDQWGLQDESDPSRSDGATD